MSRLQLLQVKQPQSYYLTPERVRKAAGKFRGELIPRVMSINRCSNDLLSYDPHLDPALPVRHCMLKIQDCEARVSNSENLIPGRSKSSLDRTDLMAGAGWTFLSKTGIFSIQAKLQFEWTFRNGH